MGIAKVGEILMPPFRELRHVICRSWETNPALPSPFLRAAFSLQSRAGLTLYFSDATNKLGGEITHSGCQRAGFEAGGQKVCLPSQEPFMHFAWNAVDKTSFLTGITVCGAHCSSGRGFKPPPPKIFSDSQKGQSLCCRSDYFNPWN